MAGKKRSHVGLANCDTFLRTYGIKSADFQKSGLDWKNLELIYTDYCEWKDALEPVRYYLTKTLIAAKDVPIHAIGSRIKEPDKVVGKIIRKSVDEGRPVANVDNYRSILKDLVGARALHLFKEDWVEIHKYLFDKWDIVDKPCAIVCNGDPSYILDKYNAHKCDLVFRGTGYRAVHYIVQVPLGRDVFYAEIQVRTLFEEAWGEVSHKVEYPDPPDDTQLSSYLFTLSYQTGQSDSIASIIMKLSELNKVKGESGDAKRRRKKITEEFLERVDHLEKSAADNSVKTH